MAKFPKFLIITEISISVFFATTFVMMLIFILWSKKFPNLLKTRKHVKKTKFMWFPKKTTPPPLFCQKWPYFELFFSSMCVWLCAHTVGNADFTPAQSYIVDLGQVKFLSKKKISSWTYHGIFKKTTHFRGWGGV